MRARSGRSARRSSSSPPFGLQEPDEPPQPVAGGREGQMRDSERAQLTRELFALGRSVGAEALAQLAAARVDPQLLAATPGRRARGRRRPAAPARAGRGSRSRPRRGVTRAGADGPPVTRAAEVGNDDDHGAATGEPAEPAERGAERRRPGGLEIGLSPQGEEEGQEAPIALPGRRGEGVLVAERGDREAVAAADGEVADGERDTLCDVPLPAGRRSRTSSTRRCRAAARSRPPARQR